MHQYVCTGATIFNFTLHSFSSTVHLHFPSAISVFHISIYTYSTSPSPTQSQVASLSPLHLQARYQLSHLSPLCCYSKRKHRQLHETTAKLKNNKPRHLLSPWPPLFSFTLPLMAEPCPMEKFSQYVAYLDFNISAFLR